MTTLTLSSFVQQAKTPSPYAAEVKAARASLADAQASLDELRAQIQAVPSSMPTPTSQKLVEQAIDCAVFEIAAFSEDAKDSLRAEGLLVAGLQALGRWKGLKIVVPLRDAIVDIAKANLERAEYLQQKAEELKPAIEQHPFLAKAFASLVDRLFLRSQAQ